MLFPTEEFLLIFLPVVLAVYYGIHFFTHSITAKNVWLLIASIIFYAWGEPVYVFLMLASILFNYCMALAIDRRSGDGHGRTGRALLTLTVAVNLLVLFWFKYAKAVLRGSPMSSLTDNIVLPIGISFYTFQAMSYVIDVYRGKIRAEKNPLYTGLYISFFPQLIAGPIVRFRSMENAIKGRSESLAGFAGGAERFVRGLVKKVLIANRMAAVADAVWALVIDGKLQAGISLAWLGAISYTLQIFFDFSGYSDMAIGLGAMFGFDLPENFDHPYISGSVTEFWRRWHITLSGWFKDYVYIPLGGSRVSKGRLIFNLFVVWLLTGIWHGGDLTFLIWGMIYFIVLTLEKMAGVRVYAGDEGPDDKSEDTGSAAVRILKNVPGHIYTCFVVVVAWVFFRADDLTDAWGYIRGLFPVLNESGVPGVGSFAPTGGCIAALAYLKQNAVFYIAAVILCMPVRSCLRERARNAGIGRIFDAVYGVLLALGLVLALTYIYNNAYSPFIYFNF